MRHVITALSDRREPVLRWEGADGTLELTGPVLANWVHKAHGLLGELGVGPDQDLGIVDTGGLHWRALAGALAAWSLGAAVRSIDTDAPDVPWTALVTERRSEDPVLDTAEDVLVFPTAPLALTVDVPADTLDFATELRTHPDQAPLVDVAEVRFGDAHTVTSAPLVSLTPATADAPAAEVVVTDQPTQPDEWGRILRGLLTGILVLRQAA